jgi:hypothetical protein
VCESIHSAAIVFPIKKFAPDICTETDVKTGGASTAVPFRKVPVELERIVSGVSSGAGKFKVSLNPLLTHNSTPNTGAAVPHTYTRSPVP